MAELIMPKPQQKPSLGRVVIFVLPKDQCGAERPNPMRKADVVYVHSDGNTCDLNVSVLRGDRYRPTADLDFLEAGWHSLHAVTRVETVPYSEDKAEGSWHWPPRV